MSADEETNIPVTTGEMTPVSTGTEATPSKKGGYDRMMQMVETSFANIPRLVDEAIQRELQARPVAVPVAQPGVPLGRKPLAPPGAVLRVQAPTAAATAASP
ncbi:UNVERIFIED_CONTAM: hypothetical protein K2H54_038621 [Gekko kuhli]